MSIPGRDRRRRSNTSLGAAGQRSPRAARVLLRIASLLVPGPRRTDWLREWSAEIDAWQAAGRPVLGPSVGAFPHAVWLAGANLSSGVEGFLDDTRIAVRSLLRRRLFAFTVVMTMALGIGATASVYSVVDGVLLAPLPFPGGDRLVRVGSSFGDDFQHLGLTAGLLLEWRSRVRTFEAMEAYQTSDVNVVGDGSPLVARAAQVTSGFLSRIVAEPPLLGRTFVDGEDEADAARVVVLSEALWQQRYGGDPYVLGRTLRLDDTPHTIVGIVREVAVLPNIDIWTPYPMVPEFSRTILGSLVVLGRVSRGVDLAVARKDLERAANEVRKVLPPAQAAFAPEVSDYRTVLVSNVRENLLLLLGAVVAVLLIACVNVANLLLARTAERGPELELRVGLGASRSHVLRQVLAEGLVLAVAGGALGTGLAFLLVAQLVDAVPQQIPLAGTVAVDGRVILVTAAVTLGTGILFGLVPLLRGWRPAPGGVTHGRSSATRGQRRATAALLGAEVAGTSTLLVGALLLVISLHHMNAAETGFDPEGLLFAHLYLPDYAYGSADDPSSRDRFLLTVRDKLAATPGIHSVGVGTATPFSGVTFMVAMEQEGGRRPGATAGGLRAPQQPGVVLFSQLRVSADYLRTLELPMVRGRGFSDTDDRAGAEPVVLVNETAAHAYWPAEDPVGKRIRQTRRPRDASEGSWATIVGVVKDFHHPGLPTAGVAEVYWPLSAHADQGVTRPNLVVRCEGDPAAMVQQVRRAIWSVDPDLPIPTVSTARDALGASLSAPRFYTFLLGTFAALAVLLACVALYGVTAHSVARRTREIGIRIALGAEAGAVRRQVLREGMVVVMPALLVGIAVAANLSRLLQSLLFGVSPDDPLVYVAVVLLVAVTAIAATWVPATRAARTDPVTALRAE